MYPFKQKEPTPDIVFQMSVEQCNNCPESPGCKRYKQSLRLNAPKSTNNNGLSNPDAAVPFDQPFYRTRAEEVFW